MTQHGLAAGMPGDMSDADLPVMTLDATTLRAEPGGQAQTTLKLRNPGQLVESFTLDVVGLDQGWWEVHPPELALYPGEDATAVVVLTPPAQARAPEQALPFGVRAISTLDPSRGVVEEGDLEVGRVFDLQPTIAPVTSKARWSARHTVTYTNWGNTPVRLSLSASDKDGRLGFQIVPESLAVPVGGSASARIRVRPRDPFLRGSPVHLPFQVRGEQPGSSPISAGPRSAAAKAGVPDPTQPVLDAAVQQIPILTRGVMVLLAALVLAIGGALGLLFKAGAVAGARTPDAAPESPSAVSATALTAAVVHLEWAAQERATGYEVLAMEGDKGIKTQPVEGAVTAVDVEIPNAKPETEYCFQVYALRGKTLRSAASKSPACATTLDDSLEQPTDVKVTEADAGKFQVTWKGDKKNRHLVLVDGAAAAPEVAPGTFAAAGVTIAEGEHCVTVTALRGEEQSSDPSNPPVCVNGVGPTAAPNAGGGAGGGGPGGGGGGGGGEPTPSTSTTDGGGSGGGGGVSGFFAQVGPPYQEETLAKSFAQSLVQGGVPGATVLPATTFPSLGFTNPATLVVVVPFASQEEAQQFCTSAAPAMGIAGCQPVRAGS
jgi:uncharacterized membrane protein YgcG